MKRKKSGGIGELILTVIWAIVIALVIRTFAFEPFHIPSGSMIPTLLVGDYLFVSKYSYGYSRYSFPFGLPLVPGRVLFREPSRGDVVVFKLPTDNKTDYVKRLIGLPGDRIQVQKGILYINDAPVTREKIDDYVIGDGFGQTVTATRYNETLPGGRKHMILEVTDEGILDDTQVYVVPEGHYLAMGDNRDRSQDSRVLSAVGFVPRENLVGRAEFLVFSVETGTHLWEFWTWPWTLRFDRLFKKIE